MNIFARPASRSVSQTDFAADFDMLRARLEVDVVRPAVIAIASSTAGDGAGSVAHALAQSLASTGYPTLYMETAHNSRGGSRPSIGMTFAECTRSVVPPSGNLSVLNLSDVGLQKRTSQRDVQSTLESLRTSFDYIVVNAEHGLSTSFETAVVTAADAVIVSVKSGRRQTSSDSRLAQELERLEDRFLGVIALSSAALNDYANLYTGISVVTKAQRNKAVSLDSEFVRREAMESTP
jgi:Mrp family chromosome partitioning ATPase